MANPNIVNVASIFGRTNLLALTATQSANPQTLVTGVLNKVLKVNSVYATNVTGTSTHDVSVAVRRSSVDYYLSFTISVPGDSTLIVVSKDTAVYLEENDSIVAFASSSGVIHCIASFEEIA